MPTTPRYVSGRPTSTRTSRRSPRTASSLTTTTPKPSRLSTTSSPRPASAVRPGSRAPTATPSQYSNREQPRALPSNHLYLRRRNASAITESTERPIAKPTARPGSVRSPHELQVGRRGRRPALCAGGLRSAGSMSERANDAADSAETTVLETSQAASVIGLPSEHFPPFGAPEGQRQRHRTPANVIDLGVEVVLQIAVLVLHGEAPIGRTAVWMYVPSFESREHAGP